MDGILCIDKPSGITSFDVVSAVRRLTKEKKAGHGGTLDPLATGVIPVFLGKATKASDLLPCSNKRYTAVMKLGITTDTGDITGKITAKKSVQADKEDVEKALGNFKGEIMQVPPMYSAIKVNGKKLYELARKGVEIEREARKITIFELTLSGSDEINNEYVIDVSCSKGTYIRTLCEDIGNFLGCGATMCALRRTMAAGFSLSDCITLKKAEELSENGRLGQYILDVENAFMCYPSVTVTEKQAIRFLNGGALFLSRVSNAPEIGICRVKTNDGRFIGLAEVQNGELKVKCLFAGGNIFANHQL